MSALEVTSDTRVFKVNNEDRFFRTITTHQNGEIQKTVYQQAIDKDTYDKGLKDNPSLVAEKDGLYFATVRTENIQDDTGEYSTYADNTFKIEWIKTGNNSLESNLNRDSIDILAKNTDESVEYWKQEGGYSQFANTAIENIPSNINFSSDDVPLLIKTSRSRRKEYENLCYPETIRRSKQDRIIFGMRYISGKRDIRFDINNLNPLSIGNRTTEEIKGSVTLPIPGGISDENSVKFDGETMKLGKALGAGAILNPTGAASAVGDLITNAIKMNPQELQDVLNSDQAANIVSALRLGLARKFTGGNLLSRLGGGVLNPNMELLFQAPTLRSFNFSFTMSARSRTEATQIKKIIRFFKQGMSVKKSNDNIFVISPNIFTINYKTGDGNEHPSIGRIKNCALVNLNTSYGNDNIYMTFDDPDRTMTQYKIDMSFQELDPITEDDYLGEENTSTGPLADPDEAFIRVNEVPLDHIGY